MRKNWILSFLMIFTLVALDAQKVEIVKGSEGTRLMVDGKPLMLNGVNWDYVPIGTDVLNNKFFEQPDDIVKAGLDAELRLLKNMNVNVLRLYVGVPPKWVRYIYEQYGIYTLLNHTFGRYGLTIDGVWTPVTDYSDERTQELLVSEMLQLTTQYKNTPGIIMYMMGNENNYGLFWQGAETEDFPEGEERKRAVGEKRGRPMYRLMNETAKKMKEIDPNHPIAICNGDVLFIDIIAEECKDIDVYGTNVYRGESFGDFFEVVKKELDIPVMFTEFGADAYNALEKKEDQYWQAYFNVKNWEEIYENAAGMGLVGNAIGGFTFHFSDGWWKLGFNDREGADVHDTGANWHNGGYYHDTKDGSNNMNEEWFGICAKGPTNDQGLYTLYPRASYYALKKAHAINPYAEGMTAVELNQKFAEIDLMDAVLQARGDQAASQVQDVGLIRMSRLSAQITTFSTGGELITTPSSPDPESNTTFPDQKGFDHLESYFIGVEANPAPNMRAEVQFNVVGNVATNPINEIFYENRGRPVVVDSPDGELGLNDINRVQVYQAQAEWDQEYFDLDFFYRTGHYHWQYEGDFFGLYPEANYGPNIDIYNGEAPFGFEFEGKKTFEGLAVAFGPELWWGANPAILARYTTHIGKTKVAGVFHEDIDNAGQGVSSIAVPQPKTRRATLALEREFGKFTMRLGGIWGGQPLNGRTVQIQENGIVYDDKIGSEDNWGGKAKIEYAGGRFNWYAQGAIQGLVANGGADLTQTFTGWRLKDSGSGNQMNFLTGFTYSFGNLQIAPNFLWQEPLVGPITNTAGAGRPRNILDDPFVVRANRKTLAGEMLLTWDPTPATWFYAWDNDRMEDAKFAASLGFVYRHLPTTQDAAVGILADGRTFFAFDGAAPAKDLWEANARVVSKISRDFGFIVNMYGGPAQANGDSDRTIDRFGMDLRVIYKKWKLIYGQKFNDWGPFDYHRDFNQTFPMQFTADLSIALGKPDWFVLPNTRIGVRGIYRTLNEFSPRYAPVENTTGGFPDNPILSPVGFDNGNEWSISTYLHINIGR